MQHFDIDAAHIPLSNSIKKPKAKAASKPKVKYNIDPFKKQVGGDHYKSLAIQPVEYITKNKLDWCEANIVKYITRWKQKGGLADVDKVIHYAEMLKELNKSLA